MKLVTTSVQMTEAQREALDVLAEKKMCARTLLVRYALDDYIEKHHHELPASFFGNGARSNEQMHGTGSGEGEPADGRPQDG